jgi:hypothetical protein
VLLGDQLDEQLEGTPRDVVDHRVAAQHEDHRAPLLLLPLLSLITRDTRRRLLRHRRVSVSSRLYCTLTRVARMLRGPSSRQFTYKLYNSHFYY